MSQKKKIIWREEKKQSNPTNCTTPTSARRAICCIFQWLAALINLYLNLIMNNGILSETRTFGCMKHGLCFSRQHTFYKSLYLVFIVASALFVVLLRSTYETVQFRSIQRLKPAIYSTETCVCGENWSIGSALTPPFNLNVWFHRAFYRSLIGNSIPNL